MILTLKYIRKGENPDTKNLTFLKALARTELALSISRDQANLMPKQVSLVHWIQDFSNFSAFFKNNLVSNDINSVPCLDHFQVDPHVLHHEIGFLIFKHPITSPSSSIFSFFQKKKAKNLNKPKFSALFLFLIVLQFSWENLIFELKRMII